MEHEKNVVEAVLINEKLRRKALRAGTAPR